MDRLLGRSAFLQPAVSVDFRGDPAEKRRREQEQLRQQALLALPGILQGRTRSATLPPVLGQPGLPPVERAETETESRPVVLPGRTVSGTTSPSLPEAFEAAQRISDPAQRAAVIEFLMRSNLPAQAEVPSEVQRAQREAELTRARIGAGIPDEEALGSAQAQERFAEAGGRPGREFEPDVAGAREQRFERELRARRIDPTTAAGAAEALRLGRELGLGDVAEKVARQGGLRRELDTAAEQERIAESLPALRTRLATVLKDPQVPEASKAALEAAISQAESALTPSSLVAVQRQLQAIASLKQRKGEFDARQRALEARAAVVARSRDAGQARALIGTITQELSRLGNLLLSETDPVTRGFIAAQMTRLEEMLGPLNEQANRAATSPSSGTETTPPPAAPPRRAPGEPDPLDKFFKPRERAAGGVRG